MTRALDHLRARVVTPALFIAGYVDPPRGPAPSPFAARPKYVQRPAIQRHARVKVTGCVSMGTHRYKHWLQCGHIRFVGNRCALLRCLECEGNARRWECLP